MTYFSNAPVPLKPSQPAYTPIDRILPNHMTDSSGFQRHPSKFSSVERLSRPTQVPGIISEPFNPGVYPKGSYPQGSLGPKWEQHNPATAIPASLTPSTTIRTSPKGIHETLPQTFPTTHDTLPSLLRPGGKRPSSVLPIPINQLQPQGYASYQRPSTSPAPPTRYVGPQYGSDPAVNNPYLGGSTSSSPGSSQNPYVSPFPPTQNVSTIQRYDSYRAPALDSGIQGTGGFAMPVANVSPTMENNGRYGPLPQVGVGHPPLTHVRKTSDSTFLTRYSTPLPLPPGADTRRVVSGASAAGPMSAPFPPDVARFEALKRAEGEAKIRREQEHKDLALAMQLDRELNVS